MELACRYFNHKFGVPIMWGNAYAYEMCQNYPAGVSQTNSPQHGDLYVHAKTSGYPYGHVAVIDSISGTSANVVEQNSSPT